MNDAALAPWHTDPDAAPRRDKPAALIRFCLNYATLAPSSHNSQPWLFSLDETGVDILADRRRALPVIDPHDRELTISCGAALETLVISLARFGLLVRVDPFPDGPVSDRLARVTPERQEEPDPGECTLFDAIPRRRTTRLRFEPTPLPGSLASELTSAVEMRGGRLHLISDSDSRALAAAHVAEADRAQMANKAFRRELANWIHSRRNPRCDGISGSAFGMPDRLTAVGALVVRSFDLGDGQAAKDRKLVEDCAALGLLCSDGDAQTDWLATGRALTRCLLTATAHGFTASYLNQPIEVPALRPRLARALAVPGFPQILLRLGRGPETSPSVRRPVEDLLVNR